MLDMQEMQVQFLCGEDPLEEELATHSSILAWKIPGMEEPGGLLRHTESDMTVHACRHVTKRQTLSCSKEDQTSTVVMNFYRAAMENVLVDTVREGAGGMN